MIRKLAFILGLLWFSFPHPACAGFRNLLASVEIPSDGTVKRGGEASLVLTTQWHGAPLADQEIWVSLFPPSGRLLTWRVRTGADGKTCLPIIVSADDPAGMWYVATWLMTRLPDGTGDGDSVTFVVQ